MVGFHTHTHTHTAQVGVVSSRTRTALMGVEAVIQDCRSHTLGALEAGHKAVANRTAQTLGSMAQMKPVGSCELLDHMLVVHKSSAHHNLTAHHKAVASADSGCRTPFPSRDILP